MCIVTSTTGAVTSTWLKWQASGKPWASPMAQVELKPFIGNEEELINEEGAALEDQPVENVMPLGRVPPTEHEPVAEITHPQEANQEKKTVAHPTRIIKKKEMANGERRYQVDIEGGAREWATEDDLPIGLVRDYEKIL